MAPRSRPVLVSWSGGKDSALALYRLLQDSTWQVVGLLCTFTQDYQRLTMHGVRYDLVRRQVESMGLGPMVEIWIPAGASNEVYEAAWARALEPFRQQGVRHVAFGDIFLEDIRAYRLQQLQALGMEPVWPIWTGTEDPEASLGLLEEFWAAGFRTRVVCADARHLSPAWAGQELTRLAVRALPRHVDPCGERGEFHTFVFQGPLWSRSIRHRLGPRVTRDGFHYRDLVPLGEMA